MVFVGFGVYNELYHEKVHKSPRAFAYETFRGPVNSAFIIEDLKYKNELISFYDSIEKYPSSNPIFNFPLKTLPQNDSIYVLGYSEDSSLVEIVSYYDRGRYFGGAYLLGWIYYKTLHDSAPVGE